MTGTILAAVLVLILQLGCLLHLLRSGRSLWWIPVLLLLPLAGAFAYLILLWRPGIERGPAPRSAPFGSSSITGNERIRELERAVEESPTVANRARLAASLLRRGKSRRAVELYEGCLEGSYAGDKTLWYEIAEAYHADGCPEKALEFLERLERERFHDYRDRRELLTVLSLEKTGRAEEALSRLERLVSHYPGQEANFHFARLLLRSGHRERARRVVAGMLERKGLHDPRYRRRERRWYDAARALFH